MTEADWLICDDAIALLEHLYPQRGFDSVEPQSRPSRLYLLDCARRVWDELPGVCRALVAAAERIYLQRPGDSALREQIYPLAEELTHIRGEAEELNKISWMLVSLGLARADQVLLRADLDPQRWSGIAYLVFSPFSRATPTYQHIPGEFHSADLVRDVFGNPFSPLSRFDRAWRSETVLQLAHHAQSTGDFSALPILADALEEASCDNMDLLDHLRGVNRHARGCWALELILK
jgi:hypothetical protein